MPIVIELFFFNPDVPKETRKKKKPRVKTPSDPSNSESVDEELLPEETDEQIPTAAESTLTFDTFATQSVVSSGKGSCHFYVSYSL